MSKAKKKCDGCEQGTHVLHLRANKSSRGEFILMRGGRRAYLCSTVDSGSHVAHIGGPATLRKIAKAILAEVVE